MFLTTNQICVTPNSFIVAGDPSRTLIPASIAWPNIGNGPSSYVWWLTRIPACLQILSRSGNRKSMRNLKVNCIDFQCVHFHGLISMEFSWFSTPAEWLCTRRWRASWGARRRTCNWRGTHRFFIGDFMGIMCLFSGFSCSSCSKVIIGYFLDFLQLGNNIWYIYIYDTYIYIYMIHIYIYYIYILYIYDYIYIYMIGSV